MRTKQEIATAFSQADRFDPARPFVMLGIGGAGMSPLAAMLQRHGCHVRGMDSTLSPVTDQLTALGITVTDDPNALHLSSADQIVLSDAIDLYSDSAVLRAKELGCPLYRRSQLLGWLLRDKKVIAITGTHGKTTTTSMVGIALRAVGLDPTIIVGAMVPQLGALIIEGQSDWAVVEACEAYDSFHDLSPEVIVLTNLELDHVDFHGTYENLRDSVQRFVGLLPKEGALIFCAEDSGASEVASTAAQAIPYQADDWSLELLLGGRHNRQNAAAAQTVLRHLGVESESAKRALSSFTGADRRLQIVRAGEALGDGHASITVVDDYAHHPTEIVATIQALREMYSDRRLLAVFQPHLYSRTADQVPEFAEALSKADFVVLTDIYPAREAPMPGVSSARIAELVSVPSAYIPSRHLLPRKVANLVQPNDVVVGMGAGNISEFAPEFVLELNRPTVKSILDRKCPARILVAYGGDSAEREVSLHSGLAVQAALQNRGHQVDLVDFTEVLLTGKGMSFLSGPKRPDVVFLAVHGTNAEDGAIQGLLELLHIPYTGASVQSSALCMDKQATKTRLMAAGIRVPRGLLVHREETPTYPGHPVVVKPNAQGSTVGLSFVESEDEFLPALERGFAYDRALLVEEWVRGMEISVPVLGDQALNPVEIAPASGRYDFASKYLPGATEEVVPARLPEDVLQLSQTIALQCHRVMDCSGATRTDMIVTSEPQREIIVLEVNTLPGMTQTSLLPNSARSVGIEMPELCEWIALDAIERYARR